DAAALFNDVDIVLSPTTAVPAFAAEGPMPTTINGENVGPGMGVPFTMLANLCCNPAISVPAGLTTDGVPIGMQIVGRPTADVVAQMRVLDTFNTFERFTNPPAETLCDRLASLSPMPNSRVFLTSGGSESVETAIKVARIAHYAAGDAERSVVISRKPSYHGV